MVLCFGSMYGSKVVIMEEGMEIGGEREREWVCVH